MEIDKIVNFFKMMVLQTGVYGAHVSPRHEHLPVAHDHAHEYVKAEAKVAKEHETKQKLAREINAQEVRDDITYRHIFWSFGSVSDVCSIIHTSFFRMWGTGHC